MRIRWNGGGPSLEHAKDAAALGACVAWVLLWIASPMRNFTAADEPALAFRGGGALGQVVSHRGALHMLLMVDGSRRPIQVSARRLTYLGNVGYPHGFDVLGFVAAGSATGVRGTDAPIGPYAALALPYWALILGTTTYLLARRRRRPEASTAGTPGAEGEGPRPRP